MGGGCGSAIGTPAAPLPSCPDLFRVSTSCGISVPVTGTGDYSDVTVVDADGRRIPWPRVPHFDDDAMRDLVREIVDKLYTFQVRSREPGFVDRLGVWMKSAFRSKWPAAAWWRLP